ncbi:MAG: oxidoreductase [Rhodospirillaceae bacterium]|jgi:Fe-S-cluster-containing dehydrogenase component|nr:oxidoreductase [Rhodospirillaceae bacterium]MBT4588692.1 oxidoreductase [Rhodospirillaceae bacterium]MBT4941188.1 oxidoreductase [Rhodospirillaceae bacterium]MBT5938981.1 oxidoreductase [Rhodospirillaceae bacterium]MBT7267954.1 oxidoreductase [Rhodospirillaceae bacterium]
MKKWNLIVDVERCHNSNNCFLSVADEYMDNEHPGYTTAMPKHGHHWINILRNERGQAPMVDVAYVPTMCNHCDDAPCMAAATGDAITKRPDGLVIIDPDKAKGQKQIVDACPYGAVWWNEEKEVPQAWIFDAHLLDRGWKEPRPVQACPTGALKSIQVEDAEIQKMVEEQNLEVLHPEHGTKPRVYYKNLNLYSKCFVGGSVIADIDGVEECIERAVVLLSKDGHKVAETWSDAYGDFKIDDLEPDSGAYEIEVSHPDHPSKYVEVTLGESTYVGTVKL